MNDSLDTYLNIGFVHDWSWTVILSQFELFEEIWIPTLYDISALTITMHWVRFKSKWAVSITWLFVLLIYDAIIMQIIKYLHQFFK